MKLLYTSLLSNLTLMLLAKITIYSKIMSIIVPLFSMLYIYHNIRIQIINHYDGDVKLYFKTILTPIKKKAKNGDNR